ncbi:MAG: hypothetical protein WBG94_11020, partial [Anaerolineales bacterium]
ALLSKYQHIESIPADTSLWDISAGRARRLAENLSANREQATIYRQLATLRTDVPLVEGVDDLEWRRAHEELRKLCADLGVSDLPDRVPRWIPES